MTRLTCFVGCAALAGCATAGGGAADPRAVQPERPTVATHAGTVAPGYAELETGVERDRAADGSRAFSVPTVLKVGLGRREQLTLGLPLSSATGVSFGLGDVSAGVKWRVADETPVLGAVAVLPSVTLPTGGDRGLGTTDAGLLLIDSHDAGPVSVDVNAGATWRSGNGTRAPRLATLWTVSAGAPVRGALGWTAELFGYPGTTGAAGAAPVVALLAGPTFALRTTLAADLGFITPLAGPQPHALYAGVVTNLGRPRR